MYIFLIRFDNFNSMDSTEEKEKKMIGRTLTSFRINNFAKFEKLCCSIPKFF